MALAGLRLVVSLSLLSPPGSCWTLGDRPCPGHFLTVSGPDVLDALLLRASSAAGTPVTSSYAGNLAFTLRSFSGRWPVAWAG
jgi:hypothetical protein